jgi:hypothetical protein
MTMSSKEVDRYAALVVSGLEADEVIEHAIVPAHTPLTVRQAAAHMGIRLARARAIYDTVTMIRRVNQMLAERRNSEKARNLTVAVAIRDNEGAGLAADRTAQLKAINVIEGNAARAIAAVQINNTNQGAGPATVPGYIIRLMPAVPQ